MSFTVGTIRVEFLALVALGFGEPGVVVAQGQPAEGHVARLILHHVGVDGRGQRVFGRVPNALEGDQGQPLDENLHAEVGHVPAPVGEGVFQQRLEAGRDRVDDLELLVEQARVGFNVPGLVHHLGGGVELRLGVRHGLDDLCRRDEGALLAVHELGDGLGL
jgi:hypothetical protein